MSLLNSCDACGDLILSSCSVFHCCFKENPCLMFFSNKQILLNFWKPFQSRISELNRTNKKQTKEISHFHLETSPVNISHILQVNCLRHRKSKDPLANLIRKSQENNYPENLFFISGVQLQTCTHMFLIKLFGATLKSFPI